MVVIIGAVLLLVIIIVAVAQSGGNSGPPPAPVAAFSGGSGGIDNGETGPFTLQGGHQTFTAAMPQHGISISLRMFINDSAGMTVGDLIYLEPGEHKLDLPAGDYTGVWQSGDCQWEMTVTEKQ